MAPPDANVTPSAVAASTAEHAKDGLRRVHPGPKGTWLHGVWC